METTERTIVFDGCLNFRDLGGYATRDGRVVQWRRLFRSDSLHRMSAADVIRLHDDLGVVTMIDLRTQAERDRGGPVPGADAAGVRSEHVPMIDGLFADRADRAERLDPWRFDMGEGYVAMLEAAGEHVAELVRLLSGDVYPAVFFCAAGKDRTGVLAALVLALLGVHEDDVVADYAITDRVAAAIIERADREFYQPTWASLPPEARGAPERTMRSMLAAMARKHGSVESYVASLDVGPDAVAGLRARLLSSAHD